MSYDFAGMNGMGLAERFLSPVLVSASIRSAQFPHNNEGKASQEELAPAPEETPVELCENVPAQTLLDSLNGTITTFNAFAPRYHLIARIFSEMAYSASNRLNDILSSSSTFSVLSSLFPDFALPRTFEEGNDERFIVNPYNIIDFSV